VGVPLQVAVIDIGSHEEEGKKHSLVVLINPEIISHEGTIVAEEGCLSVPGMRGLVPRHARIRYRGRDAFGNPIDRTVEGFHARVVQHECDHLDGILYPQRIEDMRSFGFVEELIASGALPWVEQFEKPPQESTTVEPARVAE